jgi:hypothetical protein
MDAHGDFVVAWQVDYQEGFATHGVYAKRYTAAGQELAPPAPLAGAGNAQGNEFHVNTYTASFQGGPSVAMDADGDFVIAWRSDGQDGSSYGVYAKRYTAAGQELAPSAPLAGAGGALANEFRVNTFTENFQGGPSVAMDADGDFVIAWTSDRQDSSGFGVCAKRYTAAGQELAPPAPLAGAGNAQGNEFRVNTYTAGAQRNPSVAVAADGDFVVAWESYGQDGSGYGVYAERYNAAGQELAELLPAARTGALQNEFRVNTYTTDKQAFPSVAVDADGDFVVAWESSGQDGSGFGIYAQRYGPNQPPTTLGIPAVTVQQDEAPTSLSLWDSFDDPNTADNSLDFSIVGDTNSALFSSTPIDNLTGKLTLNYAAGKSGQAMLTIRAVDPGGLFVDATLNVTVKPASSNAPPAWLTVPVAGVWSFAGPAGGKTLTLTSGAFAIIADPLPTDAGVIVNVTAPASLLFNASAHLGALNLTGGAAAAVSTISTPGPLAPPSRLLTLGSLSIDANSSFDLMNNDLILKSGGLAAVEALVLKGFNNGDWKGKAIASSTAANDPIFTTALGTALAGDIGLPTFDGETVAATDILVKYTYYGDADLNGFVNGDDESLLLYGLKQGGAPHWEFGDFDYSGHVTGDDYSLFLAGLRKLPVL